MRSHQARAAQPLENIEAKYLGSPERSGDLPKVTQSIDGVNQVKPGILIPTFEVIIRITERTW